MITKENLYNAINKYLDEDLFIPSNGFEPNPLTALQKIFVKMSVKDKFDFINPLFNDKGFMNVNMLEELALVEFEKLGTFEISGVKFKLEDVQTMLKRIKEYDNGETS